MAKTSSEAKLGLNVLLGDGCVPVTAKAIAAALRAQADALDPAGAQAVSSEAKPAKPAKAAKPSKKVKDEDEENESDDYDADSSDDQDSENEGDDDSTDADSNDDEEESDEAEDDSEDGSEDDAEDDGDHDDSSTSKEPSQKEVIGLLKKVAATKLKKKGAMGIMKKITGCDSIHDVKKPGMLGKLAKALKAALK